MFELFKFIVSDWKIFILTLILMYSIYYCFIKPICETVLKCVNGKKIIDYLENNKEDSKFNDIF